MDDTVQYSWQEKWLAITPKPFAILSMIGSISLSNIYLLAQSTWLERVPFIEYFSACRQWI